ncbi:hypothetical protein HOG16_02975 [Candidatus Woesearchaeota archaeon]|jgi:hypothetical protein|nr:hypothetical protein [Candidatus Woesearchaeota archaeon]MBT4322293.1 hypothetical protein [Candidatus Woesearchaeota archaeon]MBT4630864.1 hypothetical protein [Candidatus Woesearchaeota archaeon]
MDVEDGNIIGCGKSLKEIVRGNPEVVLRELFDGLNQLRDYLDNGGVFFPSNHEKYMSEIFGKGGEKNGS